MLFEIFLLKYNKKKLLTRALFLVRPRDANGSILFLVRWNDCRACYERGADIATNKNFYGFSLIVRGSHRLVERSLSVPRYTKTLLGVPLYPNGYLTDRRRVPFSSLRYQRHPRQEAGRCLRSQLDCLSLSLSLSLCTLHVQVHPRRVSSCVPRNRLPTSSWSTSRPCFGPDATMGGWCSRHGAPF